MCLDARQRAAVKAVCTDMHHPYLNAVGAVLKGAEIVFDKFHVLQHASAALDEVRRGEFFRAGAVMRAYGRGKRWLLLRRWKTVRGSKRQELKQLFAANRRLFKAYVLRERLDRVDLQNTRRCRLVSLRLAESAAVAATTRNEKARRRAGQPLRRHRRCIEIGDDREICTSFSPAEHLAFGKGGLIPWQRTARGAEHRPPDASVLRPARYE